jgi:hypothetical protein
MDGIKLKTLSDVATVTAFPSAFATCIASPVAILTILLLQVFVSFVTMVQTLVRIDQEVVIRILRAMFQ